MILTQYKLVVTAPLLDDVRRDNRSLYISGEGREGYLRP